MTGLLTSWVLLSALPLQAAPVIRLNEGKGAVTVEVTGLSKEALAELARLPPDAEKWAKVFPVYVDNGKGGEGQPAILGSYRIDKGVVRFVPRFPLVRGVRYRAVLRPGAGRPVEAVLSLPRPRREPTAVVTHVYPSADRVPENLLRFYLHFSV